MSRKITEAYWMDTGPLPFTLGVAFTEAQWNTAIAQMKLKLADFPYEVPTQGRCTFITASELSIPLCLLQFDIREGRSDVTIVGIITHEVMHSLQFIKDHMHRNTSGSIPNGDWEVEAYYMQTYTQYTYANWLQHKGLFNA